MPVISRMAIDTYQVVTDCLRTPPRSEGVSYCGPFLY
jgi:hypothetical protein